jgi:hypothetical protein
VYDWPDLADGGVPSPALVAAWLPLGAVAAERVPQWAACWLVTGYDGPVVAELAGLHGDDPREIGDLLPAALAECGVGVPETDTAAAMEGFTRLAQLHADGKAGERWIAIKANEILARLAYPASAIALPLGQLYRLDDEWEQGWGRTDPELRDLTRQACREQLRLACAR